MFPSNFTFGRFRPSIVSPEPHFDLRIASSGHEKLHAPPIRETVEQEKEQEQEQEQWPGRRAGTDWRGQQDVLPV